MSHIFFIYSSVDAHLGCFHILAIVNSAAVNTACAFLTYGFLRVCVLVVKNPPVSAGDIRDASLIPGSGRFPAGGMAVHSSILAWRIPWTEEPGRLQSIGSQRVRHN